MNSGRGNLFRREMIIFLLGLVEMTVERPSKKAPLSTVQLSDWGSDWVIPLKTWALELDCLGLSFISLVF